MNNDVGTKIRQEMDPPWDELRERRVLSRILVQADAQGSGSVAVPLSSCPPRLAAGLGGLAIAAALVLYFVFRSAGALPAPVASSQIVTLHDGSQAILA